MTAAERVLTVTPHWEKFKTLKTLRAMGSLRILNPSQLPHWRTRVMR